MENTRINVETTVSTTIRIPETTLEKYFRILDFIERETGCKSTPMPQMLSAEETTGAESKPNPVEPGDAGKEIPKNDRYSNVMRVRGIEKILAIFRDYDAHPERYDLQWLSTKAWADLYDSLREVPRRSLASGIGDMRSRHLIEYRYQYNSATRLYENLYKLPVKKSGESIPEKVMPAPLTDGELLKRARKKHDLTKYDLAELIRYDSDTIGKWESGEYIMSDAAKKEIRSVFGYDIFDGTKEVEVR